jgi:hypothetical protein
MKLSKVLTFLSAAWIKSTMACDGIPSASGVLRCNGLSSAQAPIAGPSSITIATKERNLLLIMPSPHFLFFSLFIHSAENTRYEPGFSGISKAVPPPRSVPLSNCPDRRSRSLVMRLSVRTTAFVGSCRKDSTMNISLSLTYKLIWLAVSSRTTSLWQGLREFRPVFQIGEIIHLHNVSHSSVNSYIEVLVVISTCEGPARDKDGAHSAAFRCRFMVSPERATLRCHRLLCRDHQLLTCLKVFVIDKVAVDFLPVIRDAGNSIA